MPNTLTNPGLFDKITIDSGSVQLGIQDIAFHPERLIVTPEIVQSPFETAGARTIFTSPYIADKHPDQPVRYNFSLPWPNFSSEQGVDHAFLRKIYKKGGVIQFCPWLQDYEFYSGLSGQDVFYLSRRHAASILGKSESMFGITFAVQTSVAGGFPTRIVVFKDTLTEATAVTSGEAWIHRTSRLMKTAPALSGAGEVEVTTYPLFRVRPLTSVVEIQKKGLQPFDLNFAETTENT